MLRFVRISFAGLSLLAGFHPAKAGEGRVADPASYRTYTGFAVSETPVLPATEVHPSLWFRAGDEARLRGLIASDDYSRIRWESIRRLAALDTPIPNAPAAPVPITRTDESIHRYYGSVSQAARASALVAILSIDPAEQARALARAKALLQRAYDGPIFQLDSRVVKSPVDEIYRGPWLQNYAHAYDLIQPVLTAAEDVQIRERLAREADCVFQNLYSWAPGSPHNHLSKPAWGLGSMALTLSSDPRAKAWLGRALQATNRNTRYFFAADGLYREGSHYSVFSLIDYVPFLYHYRNVSGVDNFPIFQPAFEYMVEVRNSRGWMPNLEDSYLHPTPTHLVAGAYRRSRTRLHSRAPLSEILQWSYETADLGLFAGPAGEAKVLPNFTGATVDYPLEIDELLTRDPSIRATAPNCPPTVFLPSGQTIMRRDWTGTGPRQRYLLFHGVAEADNHNHHDHLSFILEAEGQLMASDSGYASENYHDPSRLLWYATAPAHNTLTFDGEPAVDDAPNRGPLPNYTYSGPGLELEEKATRFANGANWQRAIAMISSDAFLVIDTLRSQQPGTIKSYLHGGRGQLTVTGKDATWTYHHDRYGTAARLQAFVCAPGAASAVKAGELTYVKGDHAPFPFLELTARDSAIAWITLLAPGAPGPVRLAACTDRSDEQRTALVFRSQRESSLTGLAVAQSRARTTVALDGLETDARVAFVQVTSDNKVATSFAIEGTFLRYRGQTLWTHGSTGSSAAAIK